MISTDDRSPSGRDTRSTSRLSNDHLNNNHDADNLYYQYVPQNHRNRSVLTPSQSTPLIAVLSTPESPTQPQQQIILRDPASHGLTNVHDISSTTLAIPTVSTPVTPSNSIADFIHHTLSSRLIPKLGSIVKRFSLNYSGEGLVTDRQRTRTVRVGIRFQVQVDSFVNNQERPRAIVRTQSAPAVEQLDSGFSSPTTDIFPPSRQLALEYPSNTSSVLSVADSSSASGAEGIQIGIGSCADSCSSGVSSESTSPLLSRRGTNQTLPITHKQSTSSTLAFHNRINQALNSYQSQQDSEPRARRSSVHVFRRRSVSPERTSSGDTQPSATQINSSNTQTTSTKNMEDASSFQVLRHFPGSNVHSLNELSWETAAFEKEIRDRIQWLGDKISSIRLPRIISQLIDLGREYARENPVTALMLLAFCLTSSAPVFIFLVFAMTTILVTFLGFLFVEGTLLTGATVIFGGVIVIVGLITMAAVLLGTVGYSATTEAYLVVTGRSRIFETLRNLPVLGRFFPKQASSVNDRENSPSGFTTTPLANGKVLNGSCNHQPANIDNERSISYYVDQEDDDLHEMVDSDDEDAIELDEVAKAEMGQEVSTEVENEVTILCNETGLFLSSAEEHANPEDLDNQLETFGDQHPSELHVNKSVEKSPSPTNTIVNGHMCTSDENLGESVA